MSGRPRIEIDELKIIELSSNGLTQKEIAAFCDCSEDTIYRNYAEFVKKGHELRNASLRKRQFDLAMQGNPTMLVWLGKQYLGQSDKIESKTVEDLDAGGLPVPAEFRSQPRNANQPN